MALFDMKAFLKKLPFARTPEKTLFYLPLLPLHERPDLRGLFFYLFSVLISNKLQ